MFLRAFGFGDGNNEQDERTGVLVPVLSVQDDFKKKTGAKPVRGIIQADDAADITATAPIIPGTGVMLFQQST